MKIAIASGKGGTGKTTLSTNLASILALDNKVVLCDLDVEEPNSGLFLQAVKLKEEKKFKNIPRWDAEKCTLCGICQEVCNFNAIVKLGDKIMIFDELCHSCYACSGLCPEDALPMKPQAIGKLLHFKAGNFNFIESRLDIGQEHATPLIEQTKDYVEQQYNHHYLKLFDSPPGTSCPVIEATKDADLVILVTEPTPFGLHDLKLAAQTMKGLKRDFVVVINRHGIGNADVDKYCNENTIPVIARIPNKREIAEFYSKGELLVDKVPAVKKELLIIKDYILEFQNG